MKLQRYFAGAVLCLLSALQLGSQSTNPSLTVTSIPAWGQDGTLTGFVYGANTGQASLYIFEFIPDEGWYPVPSCGPVSIQNTGQFSINAAPNLINRYATRFSAYLVPSNLAVPCVLGQGTIPFVIVNNAISSVSYPRVPQYQTISFGGLDWYVKTAPVQVYPGPQFFVPDNAFVDAAGQLHLRIAQCSGSWCAAEIFTKQSVGYGTYQFTLSSAVTALDPNVTLGMFTWDAQAGDYYNREWDIEFGRWGNASATSNAQYVVQPYNGPGNLVHFLMPPSASIHTVSWSPSQVGFVSSSATPQSSGAVINRWQFNSGATPVPTPGDVHLHLNLYVAAGQGLSAPVPQEVIIGGFQYVPSGGQIGFSRTVDNIPFHSSPYLVPIPSTGSGCSATVEADSPWINIVGPNPVAGGGTLQYTVAENDGGVRSGNLILQSTTCNPTMGAQLLSITQAGLVCDPSFATPTTHVGFLQTIRSVLVNGTASGCTWSVASSTPWLRVVSGGSGSGNGTVRFSADANGDSALRQAALNLSSGHSHAVLQDGLGSFFAISPSFAAPCGGQPARFGVSWVAPNGVELHLSSPTGALVGQFGASGTALLPPLSETTAVYVVQAGSGSPPVVLGSAMAVVLPADCSSATIGPQGVVNGASYSAISVSPGSFATLFGTNLAPTTAQPAGLPQTGLSGVTVTIDGEQCLLSYVSPGQVNLILPSDLQPGRHLLTIGAASSEVLVTSVSPGIFTLRGDGSGVPLAGVSATLADGSSVNLPPYTCGNTGCGIAPMVLPGNATDLYVVLYGTGLRGAKNITAVIGPRAAEVQFAGPQPDFPGLDQVNLHLSIPTGLSGTQSVQLTTDGHASNTVILQFR